MSRCSGMCQAEFAADTARATSGGRILAQQQARERQGHRRADGARRRGPLDAPGRAGVRLLSPSRFCRRDLMQTTRDREIVSWLGHLGAAGAEHVMRRFQMGRSWAYARLNRAVAGGLLVQRSLLYRQPGLYLATAEGLRWCHLQHLGPYRVGPGGFEHAWQVASVAAHPLRAGWRLLAERDIRHLESLTREPIASAKLGELPSGRTALHRPDLALVSPAGGVFAIEVELSLKAASRLEAICRAYARARHLEQVIYLATPQAARAVTRAVERVRAADRITVLPLGDLGALATEVGHLAS